MAEIVHQVYARYRFRKYFTLEKVGRIRFEIDPQTGLIVASRALVKLMPVGGFDGFMLTLPLDTEAPVRSQPKRPPQLPADQEAIEDEELYNSLYSQQT
jgi:hypothetical protein